MANDDHWRARRAQSFLPTKLLDKIKIKEIKKWTIKKK